MGRTGGKAGAPAAPIRKKKPQTWLRNSLLRESEKQANRKSRPQKYLQNVPPEVFQRRGPSDSGTAAAAEEQPGTVTAAAAQSTAEQQQLQAAVHSTPAPWPAAGVLACSSCSLAAPLTPVAQQQPLLQAQQKAAFGGGLLQHAQAVSSCSGESAVTMVAQQRLPAALTSCSESSCSSTASLPQSAHHVSLVAALCGIYSATSTIPSAQPPASASLQAPAAGAAAAAAVPHAPPVSSMQVAGQLCVQRPLERTCSSTQWCAAGAPAHAADPWVHSNSSRSHSSSCNAAAAADVSPAAAMHEGSRVQPEQQVYKDAVCLEYEHFRHDGSSLDGSEVLGGLDFVEQLVQEATVWDGDLLSCMLCDDEDGFTGNGAAAAAAAGQTAAGSKAGAGSLEVGAAGCPLDLNTAVCDQVCTSLGVHRAASVGASLGSAEGAALCNRVDDALDHADSWGSLAGPIVRGALDIEGDAAEGRVGASTAATIATWAGGLAEADIVAGGWEGTMFFE